MASDLGVREPMACPEVARVLAGLNCPWWVAGGYAIELFVGETVRRHEDVDVLVLRRDQRKLQELLDGWDLQVADPPGTLRPWRLDEWLAVGIHDIWCRERPGRPWRIQVMLDEAHGEEWTSRRDARVHRPIRTLGSVADDGTPFLVPEVQLFDKATATGGQRRKDEVDFAAALPRLSSEAKRWLDRALEITSPDHPWRIALQGT